MKKLLAILFAVIFFHVSCNSFQTILEMNKPTFKVVKAAIVDVGIRNATIEIVLDVKNNYKFNLNLKRADIELDNLAGVTFAKAHTVEAVTIAPQSSSNITINTTVSYLELFGTITSAISTKSISCKAKMILNLEVNGVSLKIPYSKNFDIVNYSM